MWLRSKLNEPKAFPLPARCYCERLAGILRYDPAAWGRFERAFTHVEWETLRREKPSQPQTAESLDQQLVKVLLDSPRLQSIAASATEYTPSVWLLEQELRARGLGEGVCGPSGCAHAPNTAPCHASARQVYAAAAEVKTTGLCLSGGGIRSATFNLGILQGLARLRLLPTIDYISSVSGGGFTHQFLAAWLHNSALAHADPMQFVQEQLDPLPQQWERPKQPGGAQPPPHLLEQPEPIRWLRRYSNYLTPRTGLFSTDTWVVAAVWLRNTFLNQIVLIASLATVLCVPHLFTATRFAWENLRPLYLCRPGPFVLPIESILLIGAVVVYLVSRLLMMSHPARLKDRCKPPNAHKWHIAATLLLLLSAIVAPALYRSVFTATMAAESDRATARCSPPASPHSVRIAAAIPPASSRCTLPRGRTQLRLWFANNRYPLWAIWSAGEQPCALIAFAFLAVIAILCVATALFSVVWHESITSRRVVWTLCLALLAAAVGTGVSWAALNAIRMVLFALFFFVPVGLFGPVAIMLLPVLLTGVVFLSLVITAGIMGNQTDGALREDMARFRALSMTDSLLWLALTGFALLGPAFANWLLHTPYLREVTSLGWLGTTLASVLAGKSAKTSSPTKDSSRVLKLLIAVGPPTFVIGMFLLVAGGVQLCISFWGADLSFGKIALLIGICAATAALFGFRLDINDFSMHAFYRDRIARCYAGASNPSRRPDRFTGFAASDSELSVADLLPAKFAKDSTQTSTNTTYPGPFPIFCSAVNLTFGQDLAWQERKAASFAFTPLYSGYSVGWTSEYHLHSRPNYTYNGFARTADFAYRNGGIHLHSAVAISGAAVSPNWGFHSDPAMAFLLTMFNVRLGWWIKNPRWTRETAWSAPPSPRFPLINLLSELMGRTTDTEPYVYLSDGGHFENMGLYELVRRRCRRILICDAEQDNSNSFQGIGMAIRKARVDFGVEINLDLDNLKSGAVSSTQRRYHALRGTITYPEDKDLNLLDRPGDIIYIKASLTGDEPGDVLNYKREHDAFPHESTADQWFSESQFESYRRLGYHIILNHPTSWEPACAGPTGALYLDAALRELFKS
jgi:hypothetical protein